MEEDTSKPGCRHSRVLTGAIASMVEASIHSFILVNRSPSFHPYTIAL